MHVMIDLETLAAGTGAAILQVGAVEFDPFSDKIGQQFNRYVKEQGCHRHFDIDTIMWWLGQDKAAVADLVGGVKEYGQDLRTVLNDLSHFVGSRPVWSHGATFDIPILKSAAANLGVKFKWKYSEEYDTRTVYLLKGKSKLVRQGTHHNALDDAIYQAKCIQEKLCS